MISPAARPAWRPYVAAWLVACAILITANLTALRDLTFPDPDDSLRLLQVRDWLAGQSWFDLQQYRMNAPEGAPMHWSRIVDLPIAAVILLLRPFVGAAGAELGALIVVPLLTLGVVMALVAKVTRLLLDNDHAVLAAFLVPVPIAVAHQLKPMRIDHHGWQMALAMAALLAALDPNRRRSGLVAGTAMAIWLAISLEGLPFAIALVALAAIRWLVDPREGERLIATTAALAGVSLLLFALTKNAGGWAVNYCDAVSPIHLAVLALSAAGSAAIVRVGPSGVALKIAALGVLGAAAAGLMLAVAPHCTTGPFEQLDPLVYNFWYLNVAEGLPVWRQAPTLALINLSFPVVGLVGSWLRYRAADSEQRARWAIAIFLLAGAFVTALFVQRASSVANLFALPGGVALARSVLLRAREMRTAPGRLATMVAALAIIAPGHMVGFARTLGGGEAKAGAATTAVRCPQRREIEALNRLPAANIAAPFDIGPSILVLTHHRIIASSHHRNAEAMRDSIRIFVSPPGAARPMLAARGIEFVVVCPGMAETGHYKRFGPKGLWAELEAGRGPPWLVPLKLPGVSGLRIWRVEPKR